MVESALSLSLSEQECPIPIPSAPLKKPLLPSRSHDLYIRLDTNNPPREGGLMREEVLRVQSFHRTVRALQLDHSKSSWRLLSWILGFLLLVVIPILRLYFVRGNDNNPTEYKLLFQPSVVLLRFAISVVSFLFLSETVRKYGFRGALFLEFAEEEPTEIRKEYHTVIEQGWTQVLKMFIPSFIMYVLVKAWFYVNVTLDPLPLGIENKSVDLAIIIIAIGVSWIFQTTTFLYTCVIFSTVCTLQGLKMNSYKEQLAEGMDSEYYFQKYGKIIEGLQFTSRRFRMFLALIMTITVFGALGSMYGIVEARRAGVGLYMAGELVVLNIVNLIGMGLCLISASKISHLHRRIVKAASSMHARETYESPSFNTLSMYGKEKEPEVSERLVTFCQIQDAWCRRAAFVTYISNASAGISVYGFVLDRFFVHTSIGGLLTTTWFILGRSLGS